MTISADDWAVATPEGAADDEGSTSHIFDPQDEAIEAQPPTADQALRYFGADFDVEGLVRRFRTEEIVVPSFDPDATSESAPGYEGFQRRFVWPKKQMDRFVESLLLGYPVPGIFLVELPSRKYLVLDGQQRLRTLRAFYSGLIGDPPNEKVFRLQFVADAFRDRSYETLDEADRRLLDNTFIQATVVVPKPGAGSRQAVYRLFERINSSGIKLAPQEIRVALYAGPLMGLIRRLNDDASWRQLMGKKDPRLKDHELILRYLALTETARQLRQHEWSNAAFRSDEVRRGVDRSESRAYTDPMSAYLNRYLDRHSQDVVDEATVTSFASATTLLAEAGGREALRLGGGRTNAAHTDAVLTGVTIAMAERATELTHDAVTRALSALAEDRTYTEAVSGSTSHVDSVETRLRLATGAFLAA